MSKEKTFSNIAFHSPAATVLPQGFNLVPQVNNFNSVFNPKPLDDKESNKLEKLLVDYFLPGRVSEDQVDKDLTQLKNITAEIKAISKQGIVLTGERIQKARELLTPYRDGAFTRWLETTFGSKKTAYNMLSYYQLYSELPDFSLKERFTKLPQKAAYLLASKNAEIEEKTKIIEEYCDSSADELVMLIQDRFPADELDGRRKEANKTLLNSLEIGLKKLLKRKNYLTADNLIQLNKLRTLIDEILESDGSDSSTPMGSKS